MRIARLVMPLLVVTTAALVLVGCGTASQGPEGAQPAPDTDEFASSVVDDLPRFPRSQEVAATSVENGTMRRSLLARDTTPRAVLDFYVDKLQDWQLLADPADAGEGVVWAEWLSDTDGDERRLRVTATSSTPTVDDGQPAPEESDVQIDILLYPDDEERPPPG